jgi:hypothetical protein
MIGLVYYTGTKESGSDSASLKSIADISLSPGVPIRYRTIVAAEVKS